MLCMYVMRVCVVCMYVCCVGVLCVYVRYFPLRSVMYVCYVTCVCDVRALCMYVYVCVCFVRMLCV